LKRDERGERRKKTDNVEKAGKRYEVTSSTDD